MMKVISLLVKKLHAKDKKHKLVTIALYDHSIAQRILTTDMGMISSNATNM